MRLRNGRLVETRPWPLGDANEAIMTDEGDMSQEEWEEYCVRLRVLNPHCREIENMPALDIRNLEALPHGLNAPFLLCIKGEEGTLIAKQWKRKRPKDIKDHVLVTF